MAILIAEHFHEHAICLWNIHQGLYEKLRSLDDRTSREPYISLFDYLGCKVQSYCGKPVTLHCQCTRKSIASELLLKLSFPHLKALNLAIIIPINPTAQPYVCHLSNLALLSFDFILARELDGLSGGTRIYCGLKRLSLGGTKTADAEAVKEVKGGKEEKNPADAHRQD